MSFPYMQFPVQMPSTPDPMQQYFLQQQRNEDVQLQRESHLQVLDRLDFICDMLSYVADEVATTEDFEASRAGAPSPPSMYSTPPQGDSGPGARHRDCCANPTACGNWNDTFSRPPSSTGSSIRVLGPIDQGHETEASERIPKHAADKLASTFCLLEMDLKETRRHLRNYREASYLASEEQMRNAVRTLADGLEVSIDQDLERLRQIKLIQQEAGLPSHPRVEYVSPRAVAVQEEARPSPRTQPPSAESQVHSLSPVEQLTPASEASDSSLDDTQWTNVSTDPDWEYLGDLSLRQESSRGSNAGR